MLLIKKFEGIFSTLSSSLTWNSVRHIGHSNISGTLVPALTASSRRVATNLSKQWWQNEWKHDSVRGLVSVSVQKQHSSNISICLTAGSGGAEAILPCTLLTNLASQYLKSYTAVY